MIYWASSKSDRDICNSCRWTGMTILDDQRRRCLRCGAVYEPGQYSANRKQTEMKNRMIYNRPKTVRRKQPRITQEERRKIIQPFIREQLAPVVDNMYAVGMRVLGYKPNKSFFQTFRGDNDPWLSTLIRILDACGKKLVIVDKDKDKP